MKKKPTPPKPDEGVDVKHLLDHLSFAEEGAVAAAAEQADLYFKATKVLTQASMRHVQMVRRLAILEATLLVKFRQEAVLRGEKLPAGILHAMVLAHPDYLQARLKVEHALEEELTAKMLVEAYRQRRDAIKIVGDQNRAEFGAIRKVNDLDRLRDLREQLKKKYPGLAEEEA